MQAVEVSYTEFQRTDLEPRLGLIDRLERRKTLLIFMTVILAFSVRVYRLDSASLSEDETNKIFAVRAYEQGDFTVNAEHPMMMKMLCYASIKACQLFNQGLGERLGLVIPEETALRLPNATFGALTVVPLFLFVTALFGFRVGLVTALLWASGLNAVWINRVVKEDTLLVFFMFTGFYLYHCAKQRPASDVSGQEKLFALTGAAFGMMMASKYFPHYFGLGVLFYHLAGYDSRDNRKRTARMTACLFGSMFLAIVIFNPALFSPSTWRYLVLYLGEDLQTHHGYLIMQTLHDNDLLSMPNGSPWYFYLLFLAVKLPLPVLIAFLIGLVEVFRHRGPPDMNRGYLFLRVMLFFWLVPMSIAGSKFLRYTLSLMPLIYITAAIAIVQIWRVLSSSLGKLSLRAGPAGLAAAAGVAVVFLVSPAVSMIRSLPYPSLYVNALGGNRVGYYFPHDEFYDLGARESIEYLAQTAPRGATIASDIPGVVEYYLERYHRPDIRSEILSHPDFSLDRTQPDYVVLQRGRVYFENQKTFKLVEDAYPIVQASTYAGTDAVRVYMLDNEAATRHNWAEPAQRPLLY